MIQRFSILHLTQSVLLKKSTRLHSMLLCGRQRAADLTVITTFSTTLTGQLVKSSFLLQLWATLTLLHIRAKSTILSMLTHVIQEWSAVRTRTVHSLHLTGVILLLVVLSHFHSTRISFQTLKTQRLRKLFLQLLATTSLWKRSRVTVFLTSTTVIHTTILTTCLLL